MKKCILIVGFNNWGKTTLIYKLFNRRRFYYGVTYPLHNIGIEEYFTVESASNDDLWGERWINQINQRLEQAPVNNINLFSAICPTMHEDNSFINLLLTPPFTQFEKIYLFLIKNKFEHHAELKINNIIEASQHVLNVNFIVINEDDDLEGDETRLNSKLHQIRVELINLFV